MNKLVKLSAVALSALLLVGCGGSDSGGGSSSVPAPSEVVNTMSGQFIDAPVEGLSYECSSGSTGTTDSTGTFTCNKDDNVTFKIGSLVLGSGAVQSVITPFHLYPNDSEKAYNVAQLIHSLDDDANPDNNIKLLTGLSLEGISINADSNSFQNALASSLASMGKTAYDRDKASAKMLSYIQANGNGNNYGISVNVTEELKSLETLMCGASEKLLNGGCEAKTCKDDSYGCPSCTVNEDLTYGADGSGSCVEKTCLSDEKLVDGQCVVKTCETDGYGCPMCTVSQDLQYEIDGSGSCVSKPLLLNIDYLAEGGLTVRMDRISIQEKTGSYVYAITYTIVNNTLDQELDEGFFSAFYKDGTKESQYGFFGTLFPGDTQTRSYSFEVLKSKPLVSFVYSDFSNSLLSNLTWMIDTEKILDNTYTELFIRSGFVAIENSTIQLNLIGKNRNGDIVNLTQSAKWEIEEGQVQEASIGSTGLLSIGKKNDDDYSSLRVVATLNNGDSVSHSIGIYSDKYALQGSTGKVTFNYSENNRAFYIINTDNSNMWPLVFSQRSTDSIYVYSSAKLNPKSSIDSYQLSDLSNIPIDLFHGTVSAAEGDYIADFGQITQKTLDLSIVEFEYIVVKIIDVKYNGRDGDTADEVTFEYKILE